jgi:hypothetical protein
MKGFLPCITFKEWLVLLAVCSSFLHVHNANANFCHESPEQKIYYQQTIMQMNDLLVIIVDIRKTLIEYNCNFAQYFQTFKII